MAESQRIFVTDLDPLKILQVMSETDYEEMIEEWQRDYLGKRYTRVERLGGPGDKGRDVVCTAEDGNWDNYQCKHYSNKLTKNTILPELAKCCYYCFKGDYKPPKKYYFISPHGVVPSLRDLFDAPDKLRKELIEKWDGLCKKNIISTPVELSGGLLVYVKKFDFSIFAYVSGIEFLEEFKKTCYYTKRFGLLRKPRSIVSQVPNGIKPIELHYIKKILDAYSEHLAKNVKDVAALHAHPDLEKHFNRQRRFFYSAEYLKAYSRETYAPEFGCFERLENEVYDSIIEEIEDDAKNGFERLKKVLKRAEQLVISSGNPLSAEVNIEDKKGICHHLANEKDDVKWTK